VAEQNIVTLAMATFIGTMGMIMMDVMADTMVSSIVVTCYRHIMMSVIRFSLLNLLHKCKML
jgi:hypothetical protein